MSERTINSENRFDLGINFDNSYAKQMAGFYSEVKGDIAPAPALIKFNHQLISELGITLKNDDTTTLAQVFSGSVAPEGATPLAQVYAGHQFGGFSQQLGDGRALLLGEVLNAQNKRFDIQLKGSGKTPYSRGGDGKASIGPVLREYLMAEAMHALNIPTTRALAAVSTSEKVMRDSLLPGAVLTRVAASHLRVGTFQFFSARGELEKVKHLADYTIARHFPELKDNDKPYLSLLNAVAQGQAKLISKWMLVGFIHGVMNTDNMTICGETIDYGPCAFMDAYDPATVYSSIDRNGRYAYANQAEIAKWNLARFAEAILPLIDTDIDHAVELSVNELNTFDSKYEQFWSQGMGKKLGLNSSFAEDQQLFKNILLLLQQNEVDFTGFFRGLSSAISSTPPALEKQFTKAGQFDAWCQQWRQRLTKENTNTADQANIMNKVNPVYIPRNHKVEEALQAAENSGDFALFEKLSDVLSHPFEEKPGLEEYAVPAPSSFGQYRTYCGT